MASAGVLRPSTGLLMLYLVLVLVIAAFALLIAALTTANTVWAWVSVGISVVAAALLVFDWLRGRQRVAATSAPRVDEPEEPDEVESLADLEPADEVEVAEPEPVSVVVDDSEPDEEATDASDLLVVSELSVEVRVVDEHPRYHLDDCAWLGGRATLSLAISEARQLGFTPCARCGPDAVLAAKHRAGKGATP
jgi:hypothetical protein